MDAVEINYRLKRLGVSQAHLAAEFDVSPSLVSNVIHNRATCHALAQHIAELIEVPILELWPTRYVFKPRRMRRVTNPTCPHQGDLP